VQKLKRIDILIVVDNHSTDNSFQVLKSKESEKVIVIQTDRNSGYAAGNNYGIYYVLSRYVPDYLLIANPDTIFDDALIDKMERVLYSNHKVGIVTGTMTCTSQINLPIAWKRPRFIDCILENFIILKKLIGERTRYSNNYFNDEIVEVDVLPGSFFAIQSKTFLDIGGFDEETFLYYEENILSMRLLEKHYVNLLITSIKYIHSHSVSINKNIPLLKERLTICHFSRKLYCKKYLKTNFIQNALLNFSFRVGLFNYLTIVKLFHLKRQGGKNT
jgi:GT2 family glycosyltransferase